ncbi:hypothetical protein B0A48_04336 [Cryoendolithus antarcticus]|uniref:Ribosomal protein S15 n=1 Tax=Cryoendolithus antarcticus TaxID=1507870 RepID=A0A1V8TFG1_9PEZI|nr:hypothetical protein B0A48_04336 [Cryoendolithus antarcticus]
MPPRIPLFQCLRVPVGQHTSVTSAHHLLPGQTTSSWSPSLSIANVYARDASTAAQRRKHRDPYAIAQAKAKKAANLSRQAVLKQERAGSLGDPIRGVETPFLRSFDTAALPADPAASSTPGRNDAAASETPAQPLNFYLDSRELDKGVKHSSWLLSPMESESKAVESTFEDYDTGRSLKEDEAKRTQEEQATAAEALQRIASLEIGSSKDRLRVNKQRCIETFGRHSTDSILPPKPPGAHPAPPMEKKERAGPDTGSSEVQVAILTAKIRTLAEFVATRGRTDRVNQRNLRLLVHRRQKLLQYVRRKERGGPRWQNLIETLGLTEGTWRGEITLGRPDMIPAVAA